MSNTNHTMLYRLYRPTDFSEVRGQEHIVKVLEAEVRKKNPAHAYLFSGSRGTGKTSIARILARKLGVSDKDLYEIDAASNRGIDSIRALREGVHVMPFESPYKFYIIDEAHMLTKEAWNALLKTLEEPPAHALFVLATTELDRVPETIQSRCESFNFKQPTRDVLAQTVADIATKEGYALGKPAAELIALLAEGSFRDAISILQKVIAMARDKTIEVSHVEAVTGAPKGEVVRQIVSALASKDAKAALSAVQEAADAHVDARTLTKLLIHRMRVVLLARFAPDIAKRFSNNLTEADLELVTQIAKNPGITSNTLRALLEAYARMSYAALPYLPLELAIADIANDQ